MTNFKKYQHIERLDKVDCEGLLDNTNIYVTAKIDGTNASVYMGESGEVCGGSRTRELNADKDNGGFYNWLMSDNEEAIALRKFVTENPQYIVYGEWLGASKFLGTIKDYDSDALGKMIIFDVFDTEKEEYVSDIVWRTILLPYGLVDYYTSLIAVLHHPTMEEVIIAAKANNFLLTNANHPGEGIVLKCYEWRNCFGRQQFGKVVLDEYKQIQRDNRRKKHVLIENPEEWIIENFLTDAEISKNMSKTALQFDTGTFDNHDGRSIGFFLNLCWRESILDEAAAWTKKLKDPTINFNKLKQLCNDKVKKYAQIGY